jgi:hypothetical protein
VVSTAERGFIPAVMMSLYLWLIVILLVAAVLVPAAFDGKPRRADREAFAADLAALAQRQAAYRASHGRYAASVGVLNWSPRRGLFTLLRADSAGFAARLESVHAIRPRVTCEARSGEEVSCRGWRVWVFRTDEGPR